jgi:hypothetical protein
MPERTAPAGTCLLACAREELRQVEQRLTALAEACTLRCDGLLTAFQHLPASARFAPFPQTEPTPPAACPGPTGAPGRRRSTASPLAKAGADTLAKTPLPEPQRAAAGRHGATGQTTSDSRLRARPPAIPAGPVEAVQQLAALPAAANSLVADLLARWPDALPGARPQAPPRVPAPGDRLADTPLGQIIEDLVAAATGRPGPAQSAAARQVRRPPGQLAATGAAIAEWLASQTPEAAAPAEGLAAALAGQGPSLLGQLLAGLSPAALSTGPTPGTAREAAPRARSLLTGGATPEAAAPARSPKAAPGSDPLPAEEASELAQQLNRLLLDQAWLRGVDLT